MSKKLRVKVLREKHVPRGRFIEDRYNIILSINAQVPNNSYLLIGGSTVEYTKAKDIRNIAINMADKIINTRKIDEYFIRNLIKKYKIKGGIRRLNENITLNNIPIIPSSSLKGAIRSRLEYKFIIKDGKTYSCYIVQGFDAVNKSFAKRHIKLWGEDVIYNRATCNATISDKVCKVCDLFGTSGLVSRIEFSDAVPESTFSLNSVIIYGAKYNVIPPKASFIFKVYCKNFSLEDLGLLFVAMEIYTRSPIIIGRYRYKFNPYVGEKFDTNYYFGLLKLNVKSIDYVYPKWELESKEDVIKKAKEAIDHYVKAGYLDLERGVVK